jgi:hypothetical protein
VACAITGALVLTAALWRTGAADAFVLGGIAAVILAACLALWRKARIRRGTFAAALTLIALAELYPVATSRFVSVHSEDPTQPASALWANRDIVEFLRGEPSPRRLIVADRDVPLNFGDWHGFDVMEGFTAAATANVLAFERHRSEVQNLFGVTHYVGHEADRPGRQEVFTGASGLKVFRNPDALPRAWSVHQVTSVSAAQEANDHVLRPGFNPRIAAVVTGKAPPLEQCGGDTITVESRAPNRVRLEANMNCRGLVVLSETHYPGWIATVDGRETPILAAYGAFRGVVVDDGKHVVEYAYRPASVIGGATLTLAGVLAVVLIVGISQFKGRLRQ